MMTGSRSIPGSGTCLVANSTARRKLDWPGVDPHLHPASAPAAGNPATSQAGHGASSQMRNGRSRSPARCMSPRDRLASVRT